MTSRAPSFLASAWLPLLGLIVLAGAARTRDQRATQFAVLPAVDAEAAEPGVNGDRNWFREPLRADAAQLQPPATDAATLRSRLAEVFALDSLPEFSLLDGADPRAHAAHAELSRWLAGGALPWTATSFSLVDEDPRFLELRLRAQGQSAGCLAALQYLLAARGRTDGYLTDPARVVVETSGRDTLQVVLHLRVWPLAAFLEEETP